MATTVFKIAKGQVGFSLTDPGKAVDAAVIADYSTFSCLITSGMVTASQNIDTEEVPGTFCDPGSETNKPTATTFTLELEALQDPQDDAATGLAKFLYDNDSGVTGNSVYFYISLAEDAAPKAVGECYISPMDFGGEPRSVLTASLSFPIEGRPELEFGTAADA